MCSVHYPELSRCCNQVGWLPWYCKHRIQAGSLSELFKTRDPRKPDTGAYSPLHVLTLCLEHSSALSTQAGSQKRKKSQGLWKPNLRGAIVESSSTFISCTDPMEGHIKPLSCVWKCLLHEWCPFLFSWCGYDCLDTLGSPRAPYLSAFHQPVWY